jgi:hypothetical protein
VNKRYIQQDYRSASAMKPDYPHLATRLFNTPLAITPGKIEIIMAALADRFGIARLFRTNSEIVVLDAGLDAGEPAEDRDYQIVEGSLMKELGLTLPDWAGSVAAAEAGKVEEPPRPN